MLTRDLDRLILEAIHDHGYLTEADLPGVDVDTFAPLVVQLVRAGLVTDDGERARLTEAGRAQLDAFE